MKPKRITVNLTLHLHLGADGQVAVVAGDAQPARTPPSRVPCPGAGESMGSDILPYSCGGCGCPTDVAPVNEIKGLCANCFNTGAATTGPCRDCGTITDLTERDSPTADPWGLCGTCATKANEIAGQAEADRLNALQKEKKPRKPRQKKAEAAPAAPAATPPPLVVPDGSAPPPVLTFPPTSTTTPPKGGVDAMEGL